MAGSWGLCLVCHIYLCGYTITLDTDLQCVIRYTAIHKTVLGPFVSFMKELAFAELKSPAPRFIITVRDYTRWWALLDHWTLLKRRGNQRIMDFPPAWAACVLLYKLQPPFSVII